MGKVSDFDTEDCCLSPMLSQQSMLVKINYVHNLLLTMKTKGALDVKTPATLVI